MLKIHLYIRISRDADYAVFLTKINPDKPKKWSDISDISRMWGNCFFEKVMIIKDQNSQIFQINISKLFKHPGWDFEITHYQVITVKLNPLTAVRTGELYSFLIILFRRIFVPNNM